MSLIRKQMVGVCAVVTLALGIVVPSAAAEEAGEAPAPAENVPDGADGWTKEPFIIGAGNVQKTWVTNIPTLEAWQSSSQPDLADELKKAPALATEKVGPPVRMVANTRGHVLVVPNKDGTTRDALFHYFPSYGGEQEVFLADLGTGERKTFWFNSDREGGRKEMISPFGAWFANGKLFWPQDAAHIAWYDPDLNDFVYKNLDGPSFKGHIRCIGADENLYIFGTVMGKGAPEEKAHIPAVFNTQTMEMTTHDPVGPGSQNVTIFYSKGIMDGDWLYSSIGNRPWRLHAYNFKTREYRLLATAPIIGNYQTIGFFRIAEGGSGGHIREADFVDGITEFDKTEFHFWLKDGKIYAKTSDIPPWSSEPAKIIGEFEHLYPRWSNIQYWPWDWTPPSTPPYFDQESSTDTEGNVVRRYRWGGKGDWHEIPLKVSSYPAKTAFLTEVNDHVIFGAAGLYSEHTFYNLKTKQCMGAGASGVSAYAMGESSNTFVVCGYPNSRTIYYDLTRPLGLDAAGAKNPKKLSSFGSHSDTHYPTAGVAGGADGRIYTGGSGAGRTRKGGGWSWYDPQTGEVGGEKSESNIGCLLDVCDSRYILMSAGGQLCCYDTTTHTFTYKEKLEGVDSPGYMVEALPGLVIGFTSRTVGEHVQDVLYGLEPVSRNVIWVKDVPASHKSPRADIYQNPWFYRRGPDGFIWTYFKNVLVRIDPRTAEVTPVGTLPAGNVFAGFADGEVYVAGEIGLSKVTGLSVPVVKK